MDTVKGYVEKVIFRNAENGYTVLSVEDNGVSTVCVGSFHDIRPGEFMEFSGEFVFHPRFGQQFKAEKARTVMPEDIASVEKYLGSGAIKGIGAVTARRIIEKFGDDTMRILDEEPERLAEIKGISMKKALEIAATQEEKKDVRNCMIFLGEYGVSNAMSVKLYGLYGQDIYTIVRDNPYQLADEVTGIGFRKADEIARRSGFDAGSGFRIKAGIIYVLQQALEQGNVYLPEDILKQRVMEVLRPLTVDDICEIEETDLNYAIDELAIDSRIRIKIPHKRTASAMEPEQTDNGDGADASGEDPRQIYYSANYYTELGIARMMADLNIRGDSRKIRSEPG